MQIFYLKPRELRRFLQICRIIHHMPGNRAIRRKKLYYYRDGLLQVAGLAEFLHIYRLFCEME